MIDKLRNGTSNHLKISLLIFNNLPPTSLSQLIGIIMIYYSNAQSLEGNTMLRASVSHKEMKSSAAP